MEEDFSSWVRRAKFSQTVYHRSNPSRSPVVRDCDLDLKPRSLSLELKNRSSCLELKPRSSSLDSSSSAIPSSAQLNSDLGLKPKVSVLESSNGPWIQFSVQPDDEPVLKAKSFSSGPSVLSNPSRVRLGPKTLNTSLESPNLLSVPFSFQPDGNPLDLRYSDFSFCPDRQPDSNLKNLESGKVSISSGRAITNNKSPESSLFTNGNKQNSKPKQRSSSPLPTTILSDVFKEARSIGKRFSSPPPSRKNSNKPLQRSIGKRFLSPPPSWKNSNESLQSHRFTLPSPPKMSAFQHLSSIKASENLKTTSNSNISGSSMVSIYSRRTKTLPDSHNSVLLTNSRNTKPKQRSKSPFPTTVLNDVFKEARSIGKRFSTPPPSRKRADKTHEHHKLTSSLSSSKTPGRQCPT